MVSTPNVLEVKSKAHDYLPKCNREAGWAGGRKNEKGLFLTDTFRPLVNELIAIPVG